MAWKVEYSCRANRQLARLDRQVSRRIAGYLENRVALSPNPRELGHALTGDLAGLWSYRVGHYRIIRDIQDEFLRVLVVEVGHRGQVYR